MRAIEDAPRDAIDLLTAAIRAVLLLGAASGFVERCGGLSALWSLLGGVGPG